MRLGVPTRNGLSEEGNYKVRDVLINGLALSEASLHGVHGDPRVSLRGRFRGR